MCCVTHTFILLPLLDLLVWISHFSKKNILNWKGIKTIISICACVCVNLYSRKKKDTKRRLYPESALVCLAEMTVLPLRQGHDSQKTDIMKSMVILPLLYPCCTWCFSLLLTCHTTTHCKIQYVGDKQLEGN